LVGELTPNGVRAPLLHRVGRGTLARQVLDSAPSYTPEWTNLREEDAGYALVQLFDSMGDPVLRRLNRLPEKIFTEFLRTAGVVPRPAQPASTMLVFTASEAAPAAVTVGAGFQVTATAADGSGDTVFFETQGTVYVTPAKIEATFFTSGQLVQELNIEDEAGWLPLGARPQVGAALLIGLTGDAPIGPTLCFGIEPVALEGPPPPASSGGLLATAALPQPLLSWDYFDGGSFQPFEIIRDETRGLQQTGIVELASPDRWRAGTPEGVTADAPLRWLRLRLVHGEFQQVPRLSLLSLNMAHALAVRTIRGEVLQFVPGSQRRRVRLAQRPVLADSLELVISTGGPEPQETVWERILDLDTAGSSDQVYELDSDTGEILFGDGVTGALVPAGFRNVVARRYQVGGGTAGAVDAEEISRLRQSVPFLTGVTNPRAATGGIDEESADQTWRTGPERIRSRNRAVTTADYALLALDAVGANIQRAHAVSAIHPLYPGASIPGVVTVFVVPPDGETQPPTPTSETLSNVASYLTEFVAPAGVQVIATAPRFHNVSVRARLVTRKNADVSAVVRGALVAADEYLHPLRGGEDRQGWPFGDVLRYQAFVRRLLGEVPGLIAVSSLNFEVDGVLLGVCQDFVPESNALLWGGAHAFTTEQESDR
jgi:predicted phage baseplate assembly protein